MSAPLPGVGRFQESDADRFALVDCLPLMFVPRLSSAQLREHQRCAASPAKR